MTLITQRRSELVPTGLLSGFQPGRSQLVSSDWDSSNGRASLLEYQSQSAGALSIELTGTAFNAFDRLVASGDVIVDGFMNIDIDDATPVVPFGLAFEYTLNIFAGNTVTGAFETVDVSGMPAGPLSMTLAANLVKNHIVRLRMTAVRIASAFLETPEV